MPPGTRDPPTEKRENNMTTTAADMDTQLTVAADTLMKIAAQEGVDLDTLDEQTVASLLGDLMKQASTETVVTPAAKTASAATGTELTAAVVSRELVKRAAAENLDLNALTDPEYQQVFDKVAAEMADPQYAEKVAEAEEAEKLASAQAAQMDELGRIAARGFHDELAKLAGDDEEKNKGKGDGEKKPNPFMKKKEEGEEGEDKGKDKEASARARLVEIAKGKTASAQPDARATFIETAALKLAQDHLIAQGIDPATGTKLATDEEIEARATQLLKEAGYKV